MTATITHSQDAKATLTSVGIHTWVDTTMASVASGHRLSSSEDPQEVNSKGQPRPSAEAHSTCHAHACRGAQISGLTVADSAGWIRQLYGATTRAKILLSTISPQSSANLSVGFKDRPCIKGADKICGRRESPCTSERYLSATPQKI